MAVLVVALVHSSASAQSAQRRIEIGGHVATASSDEFEGTDIGVGARVGWAGLSFLTAEAEMTFFPSEYPTQGRAFSTRRWEGFFGVTIGPRLNRFRPFAKVRPGFLTYEGNGPFPCILIFPPPLACTLADGGTVPAIDLGAGIDVSLGARTFVRIDASDRLLRYEGPAFSAGRVRHDSDFWSHSFRLSFGGGVRF